MMILNILLLSILMYIVDSYKCSDPINTLSILKESVLCQQQPTQNPSNELTQTCACYISQEDIHIHVLNKETGNVSVEFKLCNISCRHNYEVVLLVDESITDESSCNNHPILERSSLHSLKKLMTISTKRDVLSCKERTTLIFPYVYTGCYSVIIYPERNCEEPHGSAVQQYITTNYNKTFHINVIPFIQINWSAYEKQLSFNIWNITEKNVTKMIVDLQSCGNNTIPDKFCHSQIVCDMEHYSNGTVALHNKGCRDGGIKSTNIKCKIGDNMIECKANTANIGVHYKVMVSFFEDSSCNPVLSKYLDAWRNENNICAYTSETKYAEAFVEQPLATVPSSPDNMVPVLCGVSSGVVVIIFVCAIVIFYLRRASSGNMENLLLVDTHCNNKQREHLSKILLLYSRDCDIFMNAMEAFKNLLKHFSKCEVLDIYDQELAETIALNKTDWIQKIVQSDDVKIVMVETQCAVLHQIALLENFYIRYKNPDWLDGLFTYVLKTLKDDLTSGGYKRIFVVEIEGFKNQSDSLRHITPLRRYMIPQYTKKLLNHLCEQNNVEVSFNESNSLEKGFLHKDGTDVMKKFEEFIEKLQHFKASNPAYLQEMTELTQAV